MIGRGEKLVGKGEAEEEMGDDEQDEDEYEGQKGAEEDAEPGDGLGSIL